MADGQELKCCPFCGGVAEMDSHRAYMALVTGRIGHAVAVYCLSCSADMSLCREDVPELTVDDCIAAMTDAWNARAGVAQ